MPRLWTTHAVAATAAHRHAHDGAAVLRRHAVGAACCRRAAHAAAKAADVGVAGGAAAAAARGATVPGLAAAACVHRLHTMHRHMLGHVQISTQNGVARRLSRKRA
jgi:hypothetical protein